MKAEEYNNIYHLIHITIQKYNSLCWLKANKIKIKYNVNGGQLNTNNSAYSTSGSYVTLNGSTIIERDIIMVIC